jgi:DNA-damage-inducible protein J
MSTINVSIRMETDLKQQSERLFAEMGMNMTTAFTIFAKAAVREGRIPFEIRVDPFYNRQNLDRLARAAADMDNDDHSAAHELQEVAE